MHPHAMTYMLHSWQRLYAMSSHTQYASTCTIVRHHIHHMLTHTHTYTHNIDAHQQLYSYVSAQHSVGMTMLEPAIEGLIRALYDDTPASQQEALVSDESMWGCEQCMCMPCWRWGSSASYACPHAFTCYCCVPVLRPVHSSPHRRSSYHSPLPLLCHPSPSPLPLHAHPCMCTRIHHASRLHHPMAQWMESGDGITDGDVVENVRRAWGCCAVLCCSRVPSPSWPPDVVYTRMLLAACVISVLICCSSLYAQYPSP